MKKTLGYFFKESKDTIEKALRHYTHGGTYDKTKEETVLFIDALKDYGYIRKNAKPKVFRVIVEEV